ncbi:MAG: hypothetical protein WBM44_24530 [Waterburya sp.]
MKNLPSSHPKKTSENQWKNAFKDYLKDRRNKDNKQFSPLKRNDRPKFHEEKTFDGVPNIEQ